MIPLYSSLWCMGAVVWLYATGLGIITLIEKRYRDIIMILPGLLGLFTILNRNSGGMISDICIFLFTAYRCISQ